METTKKLIMETTKTLIKDWGLLGVTVTFLIWLGTTTYEQGYMIDQNHMALTRKLEENHKELTRSLSELKEKISADYTEFKKLQGFVYNKYCEQYTGPVNCKQLQEILGAAEIIEPAEPEMLAAFAYGPVSFDQVHTWNETATGWVVFKGTIDELGTKYLGLEETVNEFMKVSEGLKRKYPGIELDYPPDD